jgi:hypothetical protein
MLSVYDSRRCLGYLIARGKNGFEAFDADDRSVGIFRTQHEAANALPAVAEEVRL